MRNTLASVKPLLFLAALLTPAFAQDLGGDLTLHRLLIEGESWDLVNNTADTIDAMTADAEGNVYFSAIGREQPGVYRVGPHGTATRISAERVAGMQFAPDGRLICAESGPAGRLFALRPGADEIEVLATGVSATAVAVSAAGRVYLVEGAKHEVHLLDLATKQSRVVLKGGMRQGALTLSPDGGTLAVTDFDGAKVWAYRVDADGSLTGGAPYMSLRQAVNPEGEFKFHEPPPLMPATLSRTICTDTIGRFYVGSVTGVQVFDPTGRECGTLTQTPVQQALVACVVAGEYLYVANVRSILRRKVQAQGWAHGGKPR